MYRHVSHYDSFFAVTAWLFPVATTVLKMISQVGSLHQNSTFGMNTWDFYKFTDLLMLLKGKNNKVYSKLLKLVIALNTCTPLHQLCNNRLNRNVRNQSLRVTIASFLKHQNVFILQTGITVQGMRPLGPQMTVSPPAGAQHNKYKTESKWHVVC